MMLFVNINMILLMNIHMLLLMNICIIVKCAGNILPDACFFFFPIPHAQNWFADLFRFTAEGQQKRTSPVLLSLFLSFPKMSQSGVELYLKQ